MDKTSQKHAQLLRALETLRIALVYLDQIREQNNMSENREKYEIARDSVAQRFGYTTTLFWNYVKKLDAITKKLYSDQSVSDKEAQLISNMMRDRKLTSLLYLEEVAEQLIGAIPLHYQLMVEIVARMNPKR